MSSDSEGEENYSFYGKALEPYDEDAFPKKRPITVEDQIATDAQGRRRFHGAFTGGFSAGFFNTVGSLEGWTPTEFKSSRSEKADKKVQRPEDYMDEEDTGQFGIAPQVVRAKDEFASKKKRKKKVFADGPIPGEPVLETLLSSGNETVGYLLLRNMGLKNKNDDRDEGDNETAAVKVYGCEMPKIQESRKPYEVPQYPTPEIYKEYLKKPKGNTFGLGYSGLDKSHLNLFQSTNLVVKERNNKKLSISGQAFGVGAFEDDDEDIYTKDNMNKYDFELTSESANTKKTVNNEENTVFGLFKLAKERLSLGEHFPPPTVPQSFSGKHNVRKSRFEPLPELKSPVVQRKQIDANVRAKYLGEDINENITQSDQQHRTQTPAPAAAKTAQKERNENNVGSSNVLLDKFVAQTEENDTSKPNSLGGFNLLLDKFVSGSQADSQNILEPVKRTENLHGTQEMRDAAAMKMFGPLTRVTFEWQPCSLLCKRFNVPEPHFGEDNQKSKKRTKHLIFEYQKDTDSDSTHQPGLNIQKKETEEQKTETQSVEEANVVVKMEVVDEPGTSSSNQMLAVAESSDNFKFETTETTAVIDLTERVDVAKNTDLFKAIFLDSESESEDEKEDQEEEDKNKSETLKNNVLSDSLLPKIKAKEGGILSNLDFSKLGPAPSKNTTNYPETSVSVSTSENTPEINDSAPDLYGPRVPQMFVNKTAKISFTVQESDDEWVEKDRQDSKEKKSSHKHKKKNKKNKDEHKKKHKHDKKKK